jgi:hypothetical protein
MSTFTLNSITVQGLGVISRLIAGSTLEFTRIAVGDGAMPSDKTPLTVTDLSNRLFDVDISSVQSDGAGSATVTGLFSNEGREMGFFYRELGLFAKDPATGKEILYCYGNAAADAEWISPSGASSIIEKEVKITTLVGNAEKVTAQIKSGLYATKEEVAQIASMKADLDATAADGGRVLAAQMRFDAEQVLYVDAAAAAGGDGSEAKPFKTIAAAVAAHYYGASISRIKIKPGAYPEDIVTPQSPGKGWIFERNGDGIVNINSLNIDICSYAVTQSLTYNPQKGKPGIRLYNVGTAVLVKNTINASGTDNGVTLTRARAFLAENTINNANNAVYASEGSDALVISTAGTGNAVGYFANGATIYCSTNTLTANELYKRANGGGVSAEGGSSSIPSNYSQLYYLGQFTTISDLKAALLAEFGKLTTGESRSCWLMNSINDGIGPFVGNQNMAVELIKSTNNGNGYGVIIFKSHFNPASGYWHVHNGVLIGDAPTAFAIEQIASAATYGLLRVASTTDEIDCQCDDAAVTPENLYKLANYRLVSTAYNVGDTVAVPYHADLQLRCTTAGTTSTGSLDTTGAAKGQTLTDGGVTWTVEESGAQPIENETIAEIVESEYVPAGDAVPLSNTDIDSVFSI